MKKDITSKRILAATSATKRPSEGEPEISNMMLDPRYLRQSSALIQEALQKGFDVLQLANGDIVTTGTKTVLYQYSWDQEKGKLVKAKPAKKSRATEDAAEDISENESEDA
jgi:hypothetical protein